MPTRIKLRFDIPVDRELGMRHGRKFTVLREARDVRSSFSGGCHGRLRGWWVASVVGSEVLVLTNEAELLPDTDPAPISTTPEPV